MMGEIFAVIDPKTVLQALEIMWKGMAGIFVTILIIMLCVFVMSKLGSGKKDEKDEYRMNKPLSTYLDHHPPG